MMMMMIMSDMQLKKHYGQYLQGELFGV